MVAGLAPAALASNYTFNPAEPLIGVGQQVKIDLQIDTEGKSINAIQGTMKLPTNLVSVDKVLTGDSVVNFWLTQPKIEADTITFSGVITNGFSGKGNVFSILLTGTNEGSGTVGITEVRSLINDGLGTMDSSSAQNITLIVSGQANAGAQVSLTDKTGPEIDYMISHDPAFFNGAWFVSFNAVDKGSGLEKIEVAESYNKVTNYSSLSWSEAKTPYLIQDQSLQGYIYLRAFDKSGNASYAVIATSGAKNRAAAKTAAIGGVSAIILFILLRRKWLSMRKPIIKNPVQI